MTKNTNKRTYMTHSFIDVQIYFILCVNCFDRCCESTVGRWKWNSRTLAYLLVLPGSRARIVLCGGRYDPQLVWIMTSLHHQVKSKKLGGLALWANLAVWAPKSHHKPPQDNARLTLN